MPRQKKISRYKVIAIAILVLALVAIRALETQLFYDPFAAYFKDDYLSLPFPKFNTLSLLISLTLRYGLNALFSVSIVYCLFKDWEITKFVSALYLLFFVLLIAAFFLLVIYTDQYNNFIVFYVRRFLIHPILLLLFIPAIFYQKKMK